MWSKNNTQRKHYRKNEDEMEQEIELTEEEWEELRSSAMERSLNYLGYQARSEMQLRRYLQNKDYPKDIEDAIIEKLTEYHYIDDETMAARMRESGISQRKEGTRKIRQRMMQKGIDSDLASQALEIVDEEKEIENARYWLAKWQPKMEGEKRKLEQKLYRRLISKGFSYATASSAMRELEWPEEES